MKKIEGCHVRDFHRSFFLQSKKNIKIHTYTPIFLYHIAVAQKFSKKKELVHSTRMYGRGKLRKKREKSKSSKMSFSRISGCSRDDRWFFFSWAGKILMKKSVLKTVWAFWLYELALIISSFSQQGRKKRDGNARMSLMLMIKSKALLHVDTPK